MRAEIDIQGVSLKFRSYQNRNPVLKDLVLGFLPGRKKPEGKVEFYALKSIRKTIRAGERVGIIGPNGAGKTTFLKMIAGIYRPHRGRIVIIGKVTPLIDLGTGFNLELSGRSNIYLNGAMLGYSPAEMSEKEEAIVDFSELREFIDSPVKYYSSGMYAKLAFSIATMIQPEILLVDELFSVGDAHFVEKASNRMLQLLNSSQIVVFVSHGLEGVVRLCNRVIVMNKGEVVNDGQPREMVDYYLREVVNAG
jgi:ABC-type polysaccharide/polyol phosphate transport system ATPase subunit